MKPLTLIALTSFLLLACTVEPLERSPANIKSSKNSEFDDNFFNTASIYEVNVRQFSEQGSLSEVTRNIPRLKALGVDILWLMPIQPIGLDRRKGELGSYYSIKNYTQVNQNFGTLEDMKLLVKTAHDHGQMVILDWVANHTAWDHPWVTNNPDWYTRNSKGEITDPLNSETGEPWGWTDVADLNYDNSDLWQGMIDEMVFWLREVNIDGFRCDAASEVPTDFWNHAREQLDRVKPVFMLAEAEKPELQTAFDMSYGWEFHHITNQISKGEVNAKALDDYMLERRSKFNPDHPLMMFTTNHDENSWNGTIFERYGDAHMAYAVLAHTLDGMPLIYSGQEAAMDKRLAFFSKDAIDWKQYELQGFYSELSTLKASTPALWNGESGGKFLPLDYQSKNPRAYGFMRKGERSEVLVAVNLSDKNATLSIDRLPQGYKVRYGSAEISEYGLTLEPYGTVVLERQIH